MRSPLTSTAASASVSATSISPVPPSLFSQLQQQKLLKRIVAGLMLVIALLCLTSCGKQGPDSKLIKQAIALEFGQAQVELSQQLNTQPPKFKIERVDITQQTPLRIEGEAAVRIQGKYDASIKFPDQRYRQTDNDFDLYLQQQGDTDLWRLAIPQPREGAASQPWQTYLLTNTLDSAA